MPLIECQAELSSSCVVRAAESTVLPSFWWGMPWGSCDIVASFPTLRYPEGAENWQGHCCSG